MNIKRLGRALVCLLLVCCLLVTCSPVQAYAMSPGVAAAIITGVPAALVIGSSLIGQGILPGIGDAFNNLINDIKTSVAMKSFIYDDKIDVLASTNTATDETQYYVSQEVLEAVQDAAFESGAVSVSESELAVLPKDNSLRYIDQASVSLPVDSYVFTFYYSEGASTCELYLVSLEPFSTYSDIWYGGDVVQSEAANSFTYNGLTYYYGIQSASSKYLTSYDALVGVSDRRRYIGQVLSGELSYGETHGDHLCLCINFLKKHLYFLSISR